MIVCKTTDVIAAGISSEELVVAVKTSTLLQISKAIEMRNEYEVPGRGGDGQGGGLKNNLC